MTTIHQNLKRRVKGIESEIYNIIWPVGWGDGRGKRNNCGSDIDLDTSQRNKRRTRQRFLLALDETQRFQEVWSWSDISLLQTGNQPTKRCLIGEMNFLHLLKTGDSQSWNQRKRGHSGSKSQASENWDFCPHIPSFHICGGVGFGISKRLARSSRNIMEETYLRFAEGWRIICSFKIHSTEHKISGSIHYSRQLM